jgi:hypothetical protein
MYDVDLLTSFYFSAFDLISNKTERNYSSRGLNTIERKLDAKPRFKLNVTYPTVNRG